MISRISTYAESNKILLQRFNISSDVINKMVPVVNSQINEGRITASEQPYFIDFYDKSNVQIPFHDVNRYKWTVNRFFDKRDMRFNYEFIHEYKKTWYFSYTAAHSNQVISFLEAVNKSGNGTYIYNKRDKYIPYRINNGFITFNRGDACECSSVRQQLNQNININTNAYNKLVRREYELLCQRCNSLYINQTTKMYRFEILVNYTQTIPYIFGKTNHLMTIS